MARQIQKSIVEPQQAETQRLDKWLWFARVAKTRTLAARLVANGKVRLNRERITKPAQVVRANDVVTVSVPGGVRVLKIVHAGERRGPATEAATLYDEIVPLPSKLPRQPAGGGTSQTSVAQNGDGAPDGVTADVGLQAGQGGPVSEAGSGRPTKRDRRILDRLRSIGDE